MIRYYKLKILLRCISAPNNPISAPRPLIPPIHFDLDCRPTATGHERRKIATIMYLNAAVYRALIH